MTDPLTAARVSATMDVEKVLAKHGLAPTLALWEALKRVPLRGAPQPTICDECGHVPVWTGVDASVLTCAACGAVNPTSESEAA